MHSKIGSGFKFCKIVSVGVIKSLTGRSPLKDYLAEKFQEIPGLPAKIGQQFDCAARQSKKTHRQLLDIGTVKALIEQLNPKLAVAVENIDPLGMSASLGQVHRALLTDGREVAVKIQYPGMRRELELQIPQLLALARHGPPKKFQLDAAAYCEYLLEAMVKELDYLREARNQNLFSKQCEGLGIVIPRAELELSSPEILVQDFEPAVPSGNMFEWPLSQRKLIATRLVQTLAVGLRKGSFLHGDLNSGNWGGRWNGTKSDSSSLVLYDYGCLIGVPEEAREALRQILFGGNNFDFSMSQDLLERFGFCSSKLSYIAPQLRDLCQIVFEPFLSEEEYCFSTWNLQARVTKLLGSNRWWLRTAGPPWFLGFMRAVHGMIQGIVGLNVEISLSKILRETEAGKGAFTDFIKVHSEGANAGLKKDVISTPFTSQSSHHPQPSQDKKESSHLHVRVTENGREVVKVTLPVASIDEIEYLIPEHVVDKISNEVNLFLLKKKAQESGYVPQELFQLAVGVRHYAVWLA